MAETRKRTLWLLAHNELAVAEAICVVPTAREYRLSNAYIRTPRRFPPQHGKAARRDKHVIRTTSSAMLRATPRFDIAREMKGVIPVTSAPPEAGSAPAARRHRPR